MNLTLAIARANRRDALASAEANGQWVIRKRKCVRVPSKNEFAKRASGTLTCFHDLSYTLACKKCRRSESDAERERERIKALLSIT